MASEDRGRGVGVGGELLVESEELSERDAFPGLIVALIFAMGHLSYQ